MAPTKTTTQVVLTWTPEGYPTGEYAVKDDRGRVWHVYPHAQRLRPHVTGETQGTLSGDTIRYR